MGSQRFDLPEPGSPQATGGKVAPGLTGVLPSPSGPASTAAHYRIHEWATDGTKRTFAHAYDWLQDAIDQAESMMAIEAPHRRPATVKVVDVWTGEVMKTLDRGGDPWADGPFASGPDPSTAGETPPPSAPGPDAP